MASCLGCGSRRARVIYARTIKFTADGDLQHIVKRECWRITVCPDCNSRRRQTIHDEGETRKGWIAPQELASI